MHVGPHEQAFGGAPGSPFQISHPTPIEGAGMAEHPEIRELLTLRGIDYLHVDELAELFLREICIPTVIFLRTHLAGNT